MKKKIISGILMFAILFPLLFFCFARVYSEKSSSGINQMARVYDLPKDSVDVLFMGTSHVWSGTKPALLWSEYGIAGYDLCAARQPAWHTYYYLKEALKYQNPKLVVIDTYGFMFDWEYDEKEADLACSLYGMRFSLDKLKCLYESYPKEAALPFALEYIQYHKRYNDLNKEDFVGVYDNRYVGEDLLGSQENFEVYPCEDRTATLNSYDRVTERPMTEKTESYFYKILELCRKNDVEVAFVSAPSGNYCELNALTDNYIERLAQEEGIGFYSFVYESEEIGIDWSTDLLDSDHLNYWGGQKYTRYLADNLLSQYQLPNHIDDGTRTAAKYELWNYCAGKHVNTQVTAEIRASQTMQELLGALAKNPEGYLLLVKEGEQNADFLPDELKFFCDYYGVNYYEDFPPVAWIIQGEQVEFVTEGYKQIDFGDHELTVFPERDKSFLDASLINEYYMGVTVTVFDAYTGELVDQMNCSAYRNGR